MARTLQDAKLDTPARASAASPIGNPGLGGIVPEYDELSEWLNEQIKALTPTLSHT
jgi:hypothetical protein